MSRNKTLEDFAEVIRACVKCGVCQAHCPTYQVERREGAAARGKIALAAALLDGEIGLDKGLRNDITMCLMCGSCVDKCPNKVPTNEIVGAIRREVTDQQGLSLLGKGVSTVLHSPNLLQALVKGGALLSPLVLKKIPESSGLRLRFPTPLMPGRTVPELPRHTLFDRVPELCQGQPGKPMVGFFAGCAISYIYPQIGEAMVAILQRMGFGVYLPRAQRCCGIPALSSGAGKLVEELSAANVAAFADQPVEYIITACGSCNGGIGEYYRTMRADYGDFTGKVIDFSLFLQEQGLFAELARMAKKPVRHRVSYHDPCHLKTQGITRQPRELLKSLANVDFVEMEDAASCCGLGGTFSVHHYRESQAIGARKIRGLRESGAELLATTCPGCIIQLQDSINHAGLKVRAVHILELLAEALA
jgi:glycolate oxidase iron-sulfur subunit